MNEEADKTQGILRCLRCSSLDIVRSGKEPYRHECVGCGQHYIVVLQLVPVAAPDRPHLLESPVVEPGPRTA